ncbi:hypothetical protein METHPM2_660006 [Pseudomonas sp. PM2]
MYRVLPDDGDGYSVGLRMVPCRSELAREERKSTALNQDARVIVDVFREQARSYSRSYSPSSK